MTLPDKPEEFIHRVGRVGRAERMGLAISIVGTHKEKVWFHKCKSRGVNCNNTALVEKVKTVLTYSTLITVQ
jgi:ATP-dependent RNA helicase DDX1